MDISLETFVSQYLPAEQQGSARATLAKNKDDRPLEEWRSLWLRALAQPVA